MLTISPAVAEIFMLMNHIHTQFWTHKDQSRRLALKEASLNSLKQLMRLPTSFTIHHHFNLFARLRCSERSCEVSDRDLWTSSEYDTARFPETVPLWQEIGLPWHCIPETVPPWQEVGLPRHALIYRSLLTYTMWPHQWLLFHSICGPDSSGHCCTGTNSKMDNTGRQYPKSTDHE